MLTKLCEKLFPLFWRCSRGQMGVVLIVVCFAKLETIKKPFCAFELLNFKAQSQILQVKYITVLSWCMKMHMQINLKRKHCFRSPCVCLSCAWANMLQKANNHSLPNSNTMYAVSSCL